MTLEDVAPTTERCPACWVGPCEGECPACDSDEQRCLVCDGKGACRPVPAKGGQRVWNWDPEQVAA